MSDNRFPQLQPYIAPVHGPFARETLLSALREFARNPLRAAAAFREVVTGPRSLRARLRNALVFPKALAVAALVREQRIAHVHAYWLSTASTVAYVAARLNRISWSATGHRWDLEDSNVRTVRRPHAGFVRTASFVRAISECGRERLAQALGAPEREKLETIHVGVELPPFAAPRHERPLTLLCAAAFVARKDHASLVRGLQHAKEAGAAFRCVFYGSGPLRDTIARSIADAGLSECVRIVPHLPHAQLLQHLHDGAFDAAILTSRDEGIPVSLMEAMSAGLPCIATRWNGAAELIDESNGILVDVGDARQIGAAVATLAGDPLLRARLGKQARATIEKAFNVRTSMNRLAALIAAAASSGG